MKVGTAATSGYDWKKDFGPSGCCEGVAVFMLLGAVLGAVGGVKLAAHLGRRWRP
jgi:hypothetical protein